MGQFLHFSSSVVWNNIKKRTYFYYWKLNERRAGKSILVSSIRLAVPNESCVLQNVLPRAQFCAHYIPFIIHSKYFPGADSGYFLGGGALVLDPPLFPQFWLAKRTRIIHYNQLLMTKFARILCLTRKWRQKCNPLRYRLRHRYQEDLGMRLSCFGCEKKNGGHFTSFKTKEKITDSHFWIF